MSEENKNKKVIVFGGAGFLGSHVADILTDSGYQVVIFDLKKSPYLKEGQISVVGDIMDKKAVEEIIKDAKIVYNFAAIVDHDEANEKPFETVWINILGNAIILEACRKHGIERFMFASSLYVYSKTGAFYTTSKQACESLIEDYNEIYGLNYTILRYGSLYGPRAPDSNWVRRVVKQALSEKKITRNGDGEELREYVHIYDAARLTVDVLAEDYKNQAVIITGVQSMKIKDMMAMIKEILDNKIDLEFLTPTYSTHYNITPYNFTPKLAKRVQCAHYVDLGQGILSLINETYHECLLASQTINLNNQIKAIIFDCDGVILDSNDIKTRAFASLFQDYPEHLEEIIKLFVFRGGMSRFKKFEIIYKDILGKPLSEERKEELGKQFSALFYESILKCSFIEGAQEFLEKYHQKMPLFVASGTPDEEIKSIIKERGLESYFKGVFGSPTAKKDIILKIMNDFQLKPEEVIFVGDSIDDYEGAQAAGVKFIERTKENNPFKELEKYI